MRLIIIILITFIFYGCGEYNMELPSTSVSHKYDSRFKDYGGKMVMDCPPYGPMALRYHKGWKCTASQWSKYWSKMKPAVEKTISDYNQENGFGKKNLKYMPINPEDGLMTT